ncbi:MAG: tRNA pseudouridine(38-40) synthase TruA [Solobacterium sp.]|nr:tRNA pseudouridine(38-40) synthase TruA [Solobacterium sp.]
MRRFKCTAAYVGSGYDGWQSQKNGRSVQEKIEEVLSFVAHKRIPITASGRTDRGVSARGQVFMFDCDMDISARKWQGVLNRKLPGDIHITHIEETDELFHARYNVRLKQYDYLINTGPYDVFLKDTAYQTPVKMDARKMQEASRYLVGTHDFSSFNANTYEETPNQVRTVTDITIRQEGDLIRMSFTGKGFLRYMVRMMSGVLMEVGKGKIPPEEVKRILDARSKTAVNKNAPACGLTLVRVDYFEIAALNEQAMIREFLTGDELPYDWQLEDLEKRAAGKILPRAYAFTGRHCQQVRGWLYLYEDNGLKAEFVLKDPDRDYKAALSLKEGILAWAGKQNNGNPVPLEFEDPENAKNRLAEAEND